MVVDDEPANLELLVRALRRRYEVVTASSGPEALELLRHGPGTFAAILSDQRMPGMTGTELLSQAQKIVPDTVRMILTGYAPEKESVDAINRAHVESFLTKPIAPEAIERAVADAVELHELAKRTRALADELLEKTRELEATRRLLAMSLDERTRAVHDENRRLEAAARRDALTGLLNRRAFEERLAVEVERVLRYGGHASLLLCDVVGFRAFNEEEGTEAGDRLLVSIARVLSGASSAPLKMRAPDLVARWSGGSFALLLPATGTDGVVAISGRIRQAIDAAGVKIRLRFGAATAPDDAEGGVALIDAAERSLTRG
jgi:diguanylate cyclase (GGDEF)-like protein